MDKSYWNGADAAHRRVMMKATGYTDEDLRKKPIIGVPNAFMEGSPGFAHLRQVAEAVKQGIWAAGGVPVEFGIPATCGNIANGSEEMKYEQVGRDIVCMSVEFVTKVHHFDGLAMVATCDNIIAGCYLAAARLDIPSIVITGGPMQAGHHSGKTVVESDLVLRDSQERLKKNSWKWKVMSARVSALVHRWALQIPCKWWAK